MALSPFELGKLKIAAHVREELDRAGIAADAIHVKSGDIQTPRGITRLTIILNQTPASLDLTAVEVEDCESIVVGETWHKIAAFLKGHEEIQLDWSTRSPG